MKQAVNLQGLHSNQKLLRSDNVNTTIAYMDAIDSNSTLLQPMARRRRSGPIGSTNNRNRVRISRVSIEVAGFNSPSCAAAH